MVHLKELFKTNKIRGCFVKIGQAVQNLWTFANWKKMLKNRTSYMGALLQKQRNLWENSVNPGLTSKFI